MIRQYRYCTNAPKDFIKFTGIKKPEEFREVNRAHIITWRDELVNRTLSGMTIRHRLATLSSLFEYLCERNTVTHNPVKGVKRPAVESSEGKTPALGDHQARKFLDIPDSNSLKGKRNRATPIKGVFFRHYNRILLLSPIYDNVLYNI